MNTTLDEARLAQWLDDELKGEELAAFELSITDKHELFAARDEARRWRGILSEAIPAAEEPPYPEFFNHRVMAGIRDLELKSKAAPIPAQTGFSWRSWFMPLAACAGMVLAFWLGGKSTPSNEIDVAGAPRAIPVEPILYTPESGVSAEWFSSKEASAVVIVLNGVDSIPDSMDFSETAFLNQASEADSTASIDIEPWSFDR
jgi:hypothetical protein